MVCCLEGSFSTECMCLSVALGLVVCVGGGQFFPRSQGHFFYCVRVFLGSSEAGGVY